MSITKVEFKNKKAHLRYDSEAKVWVGHRVDVRSRGKRLRPTFRTKSEAEQFVSEIRTKNTYTKAGLKYVGTQEVTIKDLFAKRLKQLVNPKEIVRATRVFESFEGVFGYPPKVTEVRKADIQEYINERLATGVKPETVDREVTIISSALHQASVLFPKEMEDFEPPNIPRPKYKKRKRKKRIITDAEKDMIIHSILTQRLDKENPIRTLNRQAVAWMFEMGWLMGFRYSEVKGLLKTDFNPAARSLRVVRWKTDTDSTLNYLPERVIEILTAAIEASKSDRIFDLTTSDHTFSSMIAEACRANGITYGRGVMGGVTFHTTRHSFTSRLTKVTDIATAGEYTGHSSEVMVDYYSQADEDSKRLAMERMYGKSREELLTKIYAEVRAGELSLDAFLNALK